MTWMRRDLPAGTVTFLFTDVEGSTKLLHELGAEGYAAALAEHRRILRSAFAAHGGVEVDTQGDAFFVAFPSAPGAVEAVSEALKALEAGPIRVRMGVHTGTPLVTDEGYVGPDVNRAARIAAAGHGGQVLVSASTVALLDDAPLRDLGEHRFKDLAAPERVYQLGDANFPPLKSLYRTNLPVPATPFLGREREVAEVAEVLKSDGVRLLTLTGPGGTGKTRLALQAAAEAADSFPDGMMWVALAPLREPSLILPAVAQALEVNEEPGKPLRETLATALAGKRSLLLLDNAEHLLPGAAEGLAQLGFSGGPVLLVTSRERLQLQGERVYPVATLEERDAMALFVARARALDPAFEGDGSIGELCARLDNLPLALELAAARTVVFSPEQLLARLSQRLDLLKGGRDADPRQQTLRATIEWSYDLLDAEEQRLFRALSVFAGGCIYEAAEEVCGAEPDTLQSLLDKSLLRRRDSEFGPRYWMLETVREFAAQQLERADEAEDVRRRHAIRHARIAVELFPEVRQYSTHATAILEHELSNMRAALDFALRREDAALAGDLLYGLWFYWLTRGSGSEAREWATRYLGSGRERLSPLERFPGDIASGEIFRFTGDPDTAISLKREIIELGRAHPEAHVHDWPLRRAAAAALSDLAYVEADAGRFHDARACAEEALAIRRDIGIGHGIAHALSALAYVAYSERDFVRARELFAESLAGWEAAGSHGEAVGARLALAECALLLGKPDDAAALVRDAIPVLPELGDRTSDVFALRVAGMLAEAQGEAERCAMLFGAADRRLELGAVTLFGGLEEELQRASLPRAQDALGTEAFNAAYEHGAELSDEAAFELALAVAGLPGPAPAVPTSPG
jgi:predicted ATPase/class 3 adenylate cyclase